MRKTFFILLINLFFTTALAQEKQESCGQSSLLSEEVAKNVADDSRCFELRFYTAEPAINGKGGVDDLHQRFREKQTYFFKNMVLS